MFSSHSISRPTISVRSPFYACRYLCSRFSKSPGACLGKYRLWTGDGLRIRQSSNHLKWLRIIIRICTFPLHVQLETQQPLPLSLDTQSFKRVSSILYGVCLHICPGLTGPEGKAEHHSTYEGFSPARVRHLPPLQYKQEFSKSPNCLRSFTVVCAPFTEPVLIFQLQRLANIMHGISPQKSIPLLGQNSTDICLQRVPAWWTFTLKLGNRTCIWASQRLTSRPQPRNCTTDKKVVAHHFQISSQGIAKHLS